MMTGYPILPPDGPEAGSSWARAAEAELRDSDIRASGRPHVILDCGHLSLPGDGPLAQAGYGWCPAHGAAPITAPEVPGGSVSSVLTRRN